MGISYEKAKELFSYDPSTGLLTNRVNRGGLARSGDQAGFENGNGYRRVGFGGKQYYCHHIIWLLMSGEWPTFEIDHKDKNPRNNTWGNLRSASRSRNNQNTSKRAHSCQPLKGVRLAGKRWTSRITAFKARMHLGTFDTAEEAHSAYVAASERLHGEYGSAN